MQPRTVEIEWEGVHATLRLKRPRRGVVAVTLSGRDVGEFGQAPFVEIAKDLEAGPIDFFIDARAAHGASIDVSGEWAQWMRAHRERLRTVNILTAHRFVQLTANQVRQFAEMGDRMRVFTDPVAYDEALREVAAQSS